MARCPGAAIVGSNRTWRGYYADFVTRDPRRFIKAKSQNKSFAFYATAVEFSRKRISKVIARRSSMWSVLDFATTTYSRRRRRPEGSPRYPSFKQWIDWKTFAWSHGVRNISMSWPRLPSFAGMNGTPNSRILISSASRSVILSPRQPRMLALD